MRLCDPRDLTYGNGIIKVIDYLEANRESLMHMISSGKIDPANPAHIEFLEKVLSQNC